MSCLITQGFVRGCRNSIGGVKKIYLANKTEVSSMSGATTGVIDNISLSASSKFYEYEPLKYGADWSETAVAVAENSGTIYQPTLNIRLGKFEASKRNEILMMGQADVIAIVQNQTGEYAILGKENGLHLGSAEYVSGRNLEEANFYTITLTGSEPEPSFEVDSDIIAGLLT